MKDNDSFNATLAAATCALLGSAVAAPVAAQDAGSDWSFDSALLYSAVIMSSLLAGSFFLLITVIEKLVIKWQPPNVH